MNRMGNGVDMTDNGSAEAAFSPQTKKDMEDDEKAATPPLTNGTSGMSPLRYSTLPLKLTVRERGSDSSGSSNGLENGDSRYKSLPMLAKKSELGEHKVKRVTSPVVPIPLSELGTRC